MEFIDSIGLSLTLDHQIDRRRAGREIPESGARQTIEAGRFALNNVRNFVLSFECRSRSSSNRRRFCQVNIQVSEIPVNTYRTPDRNCELLRPRIFCSIWQDMCAIREFETILNEIKIKGAIKALPTTMPDPPTFPSGRKRPRSVWRSRLLPTTIFLARIAAMARFSPRLFRIRHLDRVELARRSCESYRDGAILRPVEDRLPWHGPRIWRWRFFIYGAYSEIFARETGFNRGLGGSMHAFFAPFGIYPNNAIVGGSGSIAPGAALFKRVNRKPGIVVCNIGDASFGCGPVWEGITFSAMDQYRKLWDQALGGGLPIMFNCMNNFYGMGGQPCGETMGVQFIARIGAGVNPEQMHAERVNGYDPLPVIDAFRRKKQSAGGGPRAGAAGHHHLPHQRPLALGCLQLPFEGRNRALAAGRFD